MTCSCKNCNNPDCKCKADGCDNQECNCNCHYQKELKNHMLHGSYTDM